MIFWAKYGTQTTFSFPMVKRGLVDLAVSADWTPAAADSAISKDQAAFADTTNTVAAVGGSPTRTATGWKITLTATEMQAAQIDVQIVDAATKLVEDQFLTIYTYGNASAKFIPDWSDIIRMGLTALPGVAAEGAGGLYTRGTGAGQIKQTANGQIDANIAALVAAIITSAAFAAGAIDANAIATDAIGSAELAASAVTEIQSAILTDATAFAGASVAAIKAKTDNLPASPAAVGSAMTLTAGEELAVAGAVWDVLRSAHVTAGTYGLAVITTDPIKRNTAFAGFPFSMTDSTNHLPAAGLTVTAQRSIDGAAFGACTNAVVEVASGAYTLDLSAADLNCTKAVMLKFSAAGADTLLLAIIPQGP